MKWTDNAWRSIEPVYKKTEQLPFIQELITGSLPREKFLFYIRQDSLYLADYVKALAGVAAKATKQSHIEAFIGYCGDCMYVENELHKTIFKDYGVSEKAQPTPSCLLYTSYLLRLLNGPVEVLTAGVLPCFWVYKKIGEYILANQTGGDNPYQSWIDTYGGEEFDHSVQKILDICDEMAEAASPAIREAMTAACLYAARFEWLFWDSAYNLEEWKI